MWWPSDRQAAPLLSPQRCLQAVHSGCRTAPPGIRRKKKTFYPHHPMRKQWSTSKHPPFFSHEPRLSVPTVASSCWGGGAIVRPLSCPPDCPHGEAARGGRTAKHAPRHLRRRRTSNLHSTSPQLRVAQPRSAKRSGFRRLCGVARGWGEDDHRCWRPPPPLVPA